MSGLISGKFKLSLFSQIGQSLSSKLIFNEIKKHNHKNLFFLDNIENINPFLTNIVKRNDMVLTMGAGTIWRYGQKFYDYLNK